MQDAVRRRQLLRVVVIYAAGVVLWIGGTESLIFFLFPEPTPSLAIKLVHGGLLVVGPSIWLCCVLSRVLQRQADLILRKRKEADDQLRQSELRYRMLFESNPQPMWLYDCESLRFLSVNDAAVQAYGYSREEFLSMTIADIRPSDELARLMAVLASLSPGAHTDVWPVGTWQHKRKSGEAFEVGVRVSHLEVDGRPARLVLARDITQERQADQDLRAYQQQLADLTHRLLKQEQETSRRYAQALHDQLGQSLVVSRLLVESALSHGTSFEQITSLKNAMAQLDGATQSVRQMLVELRPPLLEEKGLVAALQWELDTTHAAAKEITMVLKADAGVALQRWPGEVEYAAFMIAREAMANAILHARASRVSIHLSGHPNTLQVAVVDNGVGISKDSIQGRPGHLGLVGMRERAVQLGAAFHIGEEPGGGTRVALNWSEAE